MQSVLLDFNFNLSVVIQKIFQVKVEGDIEENIIHYGVIFS